MQDFRQLRVWQQGQQLAAAVHRATERFPRREWFGLGAQLCSAATSVPSNIAEGCGRASKRELARFLSIAIGSTCELETQLLLADELGYLGDGAHLASEARLLRMGLIRLRQAVLLERAAPTVRVMDDPTKAADSAPRTQYPL